MDRSGCPHEGDHIAQGVCHHLWQGSADRFAHRFTGDGLAYDLLCEACAADGVGPDPAELAGVCAACFEEVAARGTWSTGDRAVVGEPAIAERATRLSFNHEMVRLPALDAPLWDVVPLGGDRSRWLAVTRAGALLQLDLDDRKVAPIAELDGAGIEAERELALVASPDGALVAALEVFGPSGVVVEVSSGDISMILDRGEPASGARFPAAFVAPGGRTLLAHATAWNRLDLSDPRSGEQLTRRPVSEAAAHQIQYVSSGLCPSPDGEWLVDNGFTAEAAGLVSAFRVRPWLDDNPFEPDDGASKRYLCQRWHHWDGPVAWLDGGTLAVQGYGPSRSSLVPAVLLFDVDSGEALRWFAGPRGPLVVGDIATQGGSMPLLFSLGDGDGVSVWDPQSGERLLHDAGFHPLRYHAGARQFLTGNPDGSLFVVSRVAGEL